MKKNIRFQYIPEQLPKELAGALSLLSGRYPSLLRGPAGNTIPMLEFCRKPGLDGCKATRSKDTVTITYGRMNLALRAVGQLLSDTLPEEEEKAAFETFGIMLDSSRNAVMTVEHMKSYLVRLAILGYSSVLFYLEDLYAIDGEPFFGLMRGRYSANEIRELDDCAASLGIELVPCIQTLGHLAQIFRWPRFKKVLDADNVLLAEEPATYELIDKMLATWRGLVRSKKIHVGMDEAHAVGTGEYRKRHGEVPPLEIITGHLKKVRELCRKNGFLPMMWSDMFFTFASPRHDYYDLEAEVPPAIRKEIPKDVELVYWDYYHTDEKFYSRMIQRHRELGKEPVAAGGLWTWYRFWYDHAYTENTLFPFIRAAKKENVREFYLTMWGDDGAYCDFDSAFAGLANSAELAFGSGTVDEKRLARRFEFLFGGTSYSSVMALAKLSYMNLPSVIFDDPLMMLYLGNQLSIQGLSGEGRAPAYSFDMLLDGLKKMLPGLEKAPKKGDGGSLVLALSLTRALIAKMTLARKLIAACRSKNPRKDFIQCLPDVSEYRKHLKAFISAFTAMWRHHNKPFGLEAIQTRLAGQLVRTDELRKRLTEISDGKTDHLPELEEMLTVASELKFDPIGRYGDIACGTVIR